MVLILTEPGEFAESDDRLKWASPNRQDFPANIILEPCSDDAHCIPYQMQECFKILSKSQAWNFSKYFYSSS